MGEGVQVLLIVLGVIAFIGLIIIFWIIGTLNSFRRLVIKVDEAESGIDVALTKRFDLLTKMVSATKGYADHERKTLESVVAMRQPASGASIGEKQAFANQLSEGMARLNVVVEQYPQLRASENFAKLQSASMEVEENLQAARRVYNANVSYYNQKIVVFPSSIIANWKNFTKRDFFEAEASKRQDVNFNF
jgi:LemA protein